MQRYTLGRVSGRSIFVAGRSLPKGPKIMSVHPFRQSRREAVPALEPYFSREAVSPPAPRLRPLTALEQMYAYWGADKV